METQGPLNEPFSILHTCAFVAKWWHLYATTFSSKAYRKLLATFESLATFLVIEIVVSNKEETNPKTFLYASIVFCTTSFSTS